MGYIGTELEARKKENKLCKNKIPDGTLAARAPTTVRPTSF